MVQKLFRPRVRVDLVRPEVGEVVQLIQRRDPKSLEEALGLLQSTVFSFSMKVCGNGKMPKTRCRKSRKNVWP